MPQPEPVSKWGPVWSGLAIVAGSLVSALLALGTLFVSGFGHPASATLALYSVAVIVVSAVTMVWGLAAALTRNQQLAAWLPGAGFTLIVLVGVGMVLVVAPSGPEIPTCVEVEQPVTGRLDDDLVGSWYQPGEPGASAHPLTRLASARLHYEFHPGGEGRVRWESHIPGDERFGDITFSWRTVDGLLLMDDYPPASVEITAGTATISNAETEGEAVYWRRCENSV